MACAAITSNCSALFLFVKIHIFSFCRCTHRGMGYEPLVKVSWPLSFCPGVRQGLLSLLASCARLAVRRIWPLASAGASGMAVFRHWPLAVRVALFSAAGRVSVLALGRVSVWVRLGGALACGRVSAWTNPRVGEKQSTQLFKAFTKPKSLFQPFVRP